jgi:hypothetical protein
METPIFPEVFLVLLYEKKEAFLNGIHMVLRKRGRKPKY